MIEPILIILIGLFALIAQMIYFIKDDRTPNIEPSNKYFNLRWHIAGGLIHGWMYYVVYRIYGIEFGLLMGSLTWLFFDGCINSFVLNKEFFYVGYTALLDRAQQWVGKVLHSDPRLMSALLKLSFFLASIAFLIKKQFYG